MVSPELELLQRTRLEGAQAVSRRSYTGVGFKRNADGVLCAAAVRNRKKKRALLAIAGSAGTNMEPTFVSALPKVGDRPRSQKHLHR
jgi:hypothetical protein